MRTSIEARPPFAPPAGGGGGDGEWVFLTLARNLAQAHLLDGLLRSRGIETHFDSSNPSPAAWLLPFGDPGAPVRILVRSAFVDDARLVLHEVDHGMPSDRTPDRGFPWALVIAILLGVLLAFMQIVWRGPCITAGIC